MIVAVIIVVTILVLASRIDRQARTAKDAVDTIQAQTAELSGIGRINESGFGSFIPPEPFERPRSEDDRRAARRGRHGAHPLVRLPGWGSSWRSSWPPCCSCCCASS